MRGPTLDVLRGDVPAGRLISTDQPGGLYWRSGIHVNVGARWRRPVIRLGRCPSDTVPAAPCSRASSPPSRSTLAHAAGIPTIRRSWPPSKRCGGRPEALRRLPPAPGRAGGRHPGPARTPRYPFVLSGGLGRRAGGLSRHRAEGGQGSLGVPRACRGHRKASRRGVRGTPAVLAAAHAGAGAGRRAASGRHRLSKPEAAGITMGCRLETRRGPYRPRPPAADEDLLGALVREGLERAIPPEPREGAGGPVSGLRPTPPRGGMTRTTARAARSGRSACLSARSRTCGRCSTGSRWAR